MKKELINYKECKRNHFKLLLYADNKAHMAALRRMRRNENIAPYLVGVWHITRDDGEKEVVKGSGKKHAHVILSFPNPRHWSAICDLTGVEKRFCRPIGVHDSEDITKKESLKGGLAYLLHANKPEKGAVNPALLFGADWLIQICLTAANEAFSKNVSMCGAVSACAFWIRTQGFKIIRMDDFVTWLATTPYFKAQTSRLVYSLIDEHNYSVRQKIAKDKARREAEAKLLRSSGVIDIEPPEMGDPYDEYLQERSV